MNITLNGAPESLDENVSVAGLISSRPLPPQGIAVAVNGEVVRAAAWPETLLADGDVVDVVTALQGG